MAFTTVSGSSAADATTFIGTSGADIIDLNSVGTPISLGAQAGTDTISFQSSILNVNKATIRGGKGIDRLSVSDGATKLTDSFVNLNQGDDVADLLQVSSSTVFGGAGNDTTNINFLSGARFNSNKGNDSNTIAGATGSSIFGGGGTDTTTLSGDYSNTRVQGDDDNDIITFANASSLSSTTANGNKGSDTINVNAITSFGASTLFGGQGNDSISTTNAAFGTFSSGDAGDDTMVGGTSSDTQLGGQGADNLAGRAGADSLVGGAGDDFFVYTGTGDVATGEVISGGAGGQTLGDAIQLTGSTDFANLSTNRILTDFGVERIEITSALSGTFIGSQLTGQAISINGAGAAGNSTLVVNTAGGGTVDLTNLTFAAVGSGTAFAAGDVVQLDSANGGTNVTGTTFTDTITGGTGVDQLNGGDGNDTINGGTNADVLNGNAGDNDFEYSALGQGGNVIAGNAATALTAGDTINGFVTTDDQIDVAATATGTAAAAAVGAGTGQAFSSNTGAGGTGVGVISVNYDFSATATTAGVIAALQAGYDTSVTIGAGDTAYFAILDADGANPDFYNIFEVTNTTGGNLVDAAIADAGVNISLLATTSAGTTVALSDFILT